MSQTTDLSNLSNTEKYNMRVESAYGKLSAVPPKQYKRGLAVARGLDAKQTAPKGKARKRTVAKTSGK
jgi:hypothetical protein